MGLLDGQKSLLLDKKLGGRGHINRDQQVVPLARWLSRVQLCDPMDCSRPGSSVPGILQARILEWVTMPSSRRIFPAQGSNPSLPPCRRILFQLSSWGSPFARLGCYKTAYYQNVKRKEMKIKLGSG